MLTPEERYRYRKQLDVSGWGEEGQGRLKEATVFIAGAGGLGAPVALYLAAAGVGCIRICDEGTVDRSNLNRQLLYAEAEVGERKAEAAARRLAELNPRVRVVALSEALDRRSADRLIGGADIILDCLDNFEGRYVLNEQAVRKGIPLVHGGIHGFTGQVTFLRSPRTPCLACIFPHAPAYEQVPVVGPTAGVIGSVEASEALKYLAGVGEPLENRLLIWEGEAAEWDMVSVQRNPCCPVCGRSLQGRYRPR